MEGGEEDEREGEGDDREEERMGEERGAGGIGGEGEGSWGGEGGGEEGRGNLILALCTEILWLDRKMNGRARILSKSS